VQWGAWASVGMAAQSTAVLARIERSGMGVIKPATGLKLLHVMLSSGQSAAQVRNRLGKSVVMMHVRHLVAAV